MTNKSTSIGLRPASETQGALLVELTIPKTTYEALAVVANESGRSIGSVVKAAIGIYLVNRMTEQQKRPAHEATKAQEHALTTTNDLEPIDLW